MWTRFFFIFLGIIFAAGMPPPVPRPGIPPMTQAQAVSAPGILNRPPAPTAAVPAPQPPVTKPLFPSAGQVRWNSWKGVYCMFKVKWLVHR